MKAWTCRRYGGPDTLALQALPLQPLGPYDIRIAMRATTVSSGDARVRALRLPPGFGMLGPVMLGFGGPRRFVLGTELAGIVTEIGEKVTRFRDGEAVIAFPDLAMGAHAEYVTMDSRGLIAHKPASLSFEAAASLCFGGLTVRHFIRRAGLKSGERLLVLGASGTVGSAFVQLARHLGAHVTALTSAANADLALRLGADEVIAYDESDFTRSAQCWDVIADTVMGSSFTSCRPVMNQSGRYLAIAGGLADLLRWRRGSQRTIASPAQSSQADLDAMVALAADGAFLPLIDSHYSFEDLPSAHARVDSGRKRGSVVVVASDQPI